MATNEELGVVDALDECPHCGDDLYPDEICDCVQPGRIEHCDECGNFFDDNPGKTVCKTCEDWMVTR